MSGQFTLKLLNRMFVVTRTTEAHALVSTPLLSLEGDDLPEPSPDQDQTIINGICGGLEGCAGEWVEPAWILDEISASRSLKFTGTRQP